MTEGEGEEEGEGDYAVRVLPRNDFTVQVRLDQLSPRSAARGKTVMDTRYLT